MKEKMIATVKAGELEQMLSDALIACSGKSAEVVNAEGCVTRDGRTLIEGNVQFRVVDDGGSSTWEELEEAGFEINVRDEESPLSINPVEVVIFGQ